MRAARLDYHMRLSETLRESQMMKLLSWQTRSAQNEFPPVRPSLPCRRNLGRRAPRFLEGNCVVPEARSPHTSPMGTPRGTPYPPAFAQGTRQCLRLQGGAGFLVEQSTTGTRATHAGCGSKGSTRAAKTHFCGCWHGNSVGGNNLPSQTPHLAVARADRKGDAGRIAL